jgi:DNA excision repair protein ERCC-2
VQDFAEAIHPVQAIRAHQRIQDSRPQGYRREVPVSHQYENDEFMLDIRGRIDGVLESQGRTLIEEIKTTQTEPNENNELHWGQAKVYSYIYATDRNLKEIDVRLTYYLFRSRRVEEYTRSHTKDELAVFFSGLTERFLEWQKVLADWRQLRDESITSGSFPFQSYRSGQREMAIAVYRTVKAGNQLLLQAPTGIGKTMAALFPAAKALSEGSTHRIFYLTARTTGKAAAEKALHEMSDQGLHLKSLTVTAKRKICFNPDKTCSADECCYAQGYYDRLEGALTDLFNERHITCQLIEQVARKYTICPFELSLETALWVDCIVCDYNYVFDPRVNLRRVFQDTARENTFIVDEAHNLPDRAREMFSAHLDKTSFLELKKVFRNLRKLSRCLGQINWRLARLRKKLGNKGTPASSKQAPDQLYPKLRELEQISESLLLSERYRDLPHRESLLDLYFQVSGFLHTADRYDNCYVTCYQPRGRDLRLKLFCLDPSSQLKEVLKECKSSIFFSGTLTPLNYFKSILGCGDEAKQFQVPSPFPPQNLCLTIADRTSTIFRQREETKEEVAGLLSAFVNGRIGNYLLFFPSYQYMNLIVDCFPPQNPRDETIIQGPDMTEMERSEFVHRFTEERSNRLVGFAVMGGVFGEGIDLAGERLTGAAVVGVGLPALSFERDLICRHYSERGHSGFDYAYRFPGINRVLQAAGRVIRAETDRGSVLLIDQRYSHQSYKNLLPTEWKPLSVGDNPQLSSQLNSFWGNPNPRF